MFGSGCPAVRLGRTFHVGEDVDDWLTGLRQIHEAVDLLLDPAGGRLGHALALADDPARFIDGLHLLGPTGAQRVE